jgi:hypothetical protein
MSSLLQSGTPALQQLLHQDHAVAASCLLAANLFCLSSKDTSLQSRIGAFKNGVKSIASCPQQRLMRRYGVATPEAALELLASSLAVTARNSSPCLVTFVKCGQATTGPDFVTQVCSNDEDNDALLRCEGAKQGDEGYILFRQAELSAAASRRNILGSSSVAAAITGITQSTIEQCSAALCMSSYIDFWRETDSRGLLPWDKPDCVAVHGGIPALASSRPIGISGGVQLPVLCTLASYLERSSPPSPGAALLLLRRLLLMLKALHSSSLVALSLCSAAIVCERPHHPDEYHSAVMGSAMFADIAEKQR